MGLFRKVFGFLGFSKDDENNHDHDSNDNNNSDDRHAAAGAGQHRPTNFRVKETGQPRRGFSVKAQVVNDRPQQQQLGPVLAPSTSSDGGVQGLGWYAKHLRIDEDGDVANKFFVDVSSEKPARFTLNNDTRPVKVKKQVLSPEGKVLQCVEHRGRLQVV